MNIRQEYYIWMCERIAVTKRRHYKRLLNFLHGTPFTWTNEYDENREEDGLELRVMFGRDRGYDINHIIELMSDDPCSMLEMMVALSIRCEEHIMFDPDFGDRTYKWFWFMIESSGLIWLRDDNFSTSEATVIVRKILNREYGPCGEGGLFRLKNCDIDLRGVEIWYQLCWYLEEYLEEVDYFETY